MSLQAYAVAGDCSIIPESELDPRAAAILRRLSQCAYVRDQHRTAIARISREIAKLQAELAALEVQP